MAQKKPPLFFGNLFEYVKITKQYFAGKIHCLNLNKNNCILPFSSFIEKTIF